MLTPEVYEKLGVFYLGRAWDEAAGAAKADPVLYDSRHLTTHGVIVGMTGSGKTGLGVVLLEEAAIDAIPVIAIDPKGDLGNLLLTFPDLAPEQFAPWVSDGEDPAAVAARWRDGLAATGQDGARIARLTAAAERVIYTPGASAGRRISVLRSLGAPAPGADSDTVRERAVAAVSGLLTLIGRDADPIRSAEHTLIANVLLGAWSQGRTLDLPALLREIVSPPFDRIGVMDLESVVPAADRQALAMAINNLIASPGFAGFMEGEPLDVASLLRSPDGRPRVSILSIAHLGEAERMFFVTLLLGEVIAWMRAQAGTTSLRAILYMDEVAGYFPPVAAPPSKAPMLTLLKQARAYGLGVVLATQNPVDLDYKGLANAGTWFLGRLQTERDKLRVLEGLEGASAASGKGFDRARADAVLSGLGKRVFMLHDVNEEGPRLLETRWALSYLAGPMTRQQIAAVSTPAVAPASAPTPAPTPAPSPQAAATTRPVVGAGVNEAFLPVVADLPIVYSPSLMARMTIHYHQAKSGIDTFVAPVMVVPIGIEGPQWGAGWVLAMGEPALAGAPADGAAFDALPAPAMREKTWATWAKSIVQHVVKDRPLVVLHAPAVGLWGQPGESAPQLAARAQHAARERRDADLEAIRRKYGPKVTRLQQQLANAEARIDREQGQKETSMISTGFDAVIAVFGGGSTLNRARRAATSAHRASRQSGDVERAREQADRYRADLAAIDHELREAVAAIHARWDPARIAIEQGAIRAKKADVHVERVALLWLPWRPAQDGSRAPAWPITAG